MVYSQMRGPNETLWTYWIAMSIRALLHPGPGATSH